MNTIGGIQGMTAGPEPKSYFQMWQFWAGVGVILLIAYFIFKSKK